jgi:glycosyltransferase involved in cell wall biosynthesis
LACEARACGEHAEKPEEERTADMKTPLVTVVIDTYNYGQYVEAAVESVLQQNFPHENMEILVVDDGSTDDTAQRLQKFAGRIQYLQKLNGGQASAFNFGFERAQGEIIALLDADDMWLPEKLNRVCETFEKNPDAGMVYHRVSLWKETEETVDSYFAPISGRVTEKREDLLRYPMVGTSCLAFRRDALKGLLPLPEVLHSQADAYLTALIIEVTSVVALPEFLARYRLHGANLFQLNDAGDCTRQIEHRMQMRAALLAEIECWLEGNGHDLESTDIQDYLKQWVKAQELDEFRLRAPGRWRYFRHLYEYPKIYADIMSRRHRIYSYMRAYGALFLGYHHLHRLDDARNLYKRCCAKLTGKAGTAEEGKSAA